jgi:hypothetical protein
LTSVPHSTPSMRHSFSPRWSPCRKARDWFTSYLIRGAPISGLGWRPERGHQDTLWGLQWEYPGAAALPHMVTRHLPIQHLPRDICPVTFAQRYLPRTKFAQKTFAQRDICRDGRLLIRRLPRRHLPRKTFAQKDICPEHICPEGCLPRRTFAQKDICPQGFCPEY